MDGKYKAAADALAGGVGPDPDFIYGRGQIWSTSGKDTEGQYLGEVVRHVVYKHYPVIDETDFFEQAREQYRAEYGSRPDDQLPIPDKEGYVLNYWGDARHRPEVIEKYGQSDFRLFDTAEERQQFDKELREFCGSLEGSPWIMTSNQEGPRVKYRVIVHATVRYRDQTYVLQREYERGYSPGVCFFSWEENNQSCDHNRAGMFDDQYPGILTEADEALSEGCDIRMFPLVDFRIEFKE